MRNAVFGIAVVLGMAGLLLVGCGDNPSPAPGKTCTYKGKTYQDQQEFMDDCNSCKCNPEGTVGVSCTKVLCFDGGNKLDGAGTVDGAGKTCTYKGKIYQDQEEFMDQCNTCKCNPEGTVGVGCSAKLCPDGGGSNG